MTALPRICAIIVAVRNNTNARQLALARAASTRCAGLRSSLGLNELFCHLCYRSRVCCQLCLSAFTLPLSTVGQSSSTGASGSSAVPPFIATFSGRYPVDWSLVPTIQPALDIPSDTDLGQCVCDLTWASCDANCNCDADCSETEKLRFSGALPEGPKATRVLTCVDPNLVSINDRGALTVTLIDNMLCVAEDNNPSLGRFLTAPTSLTDAQFSKARTDAAYLYEPVDPLAAAAAAAASAATDPNYKVGDIVVAARQDLTVPNPDVNQVFYQTNGSVQCCERTKCDMRARRPQQLVPRLSLVCFIVVSVGGPMLR